MDSDLDTALERILAPEYIAGLTGRSVGDLRALRDDGREVETQLSFLRRVVQGRHDIVAGEVDRRRRGGHLDDVAALVDCLPQLLADRNRAPGPGRRPSSIGNEEPSGHLVDQLRAIDATAPLDAVPSLDEGTLEEATVALASLEAEVSSLRHRVFERIDALEAELTRRYRDGDARVDDLLIGGADR
jgi:hypothetical protein